MPSHLSVEKEAQFPNLDRARYRVTSNPAWEYNCIAHALAEKDDEWWWPDDGVAGVFWPAGLATDETLDCFVQACELHGYQRCDDADREDGFVKIALYVDQDGVPTHAARQLPSGAWTSKLGEWEDIEHDTLDLLEGAPGKGHAYGSVAVVLKRSIGVVADIARPHTRRTRL